MGGVIVCVIVCVIIWAGVGVRVGMSIRLWSCLIPILLCSWEMILICSGTRWPSLFPLEFRALCRRRFSEVLQQAGEAVLCSCVARSCSHHVF